MTTLVIHLTDLHLREEDAGFIARTQRIADAALSSIEMIDAIHLVLCGDLTNWGLATEFVVAERFIDALVEATHARSGIKPSIVMVAGNHDCDFSSDQSVRETLIGAVARRTDAIPEAVAQEIAKPLKNFFDLQERYCPPTRISPWVAIHTVTTGLPIEYVLLNSSVLSAKREVQGKLFVPIPTLPEPDAKSKTVFVMHHPLNWLEPENSRELAQYVSQRGELFLMGHEHTQTAHQVSDLYGDSSIVYLKGHVLREPSDPSASAFQTVFLHPTNGYRTETYRWDGSTYLRDEGRSLAEYRPWSKLDRRTKLALTKDGYGTLASSGASFSHPKKEVVLLPDIYVWPTLKIVNPERDTGNTFVDDLHFNAEELLSRYQERSSTVVIKGGEQFGKSALCRMLALNLSMRGLKPLLISATSVSSWREKSLNERIDKAIGGMYGRNSIDEYRQLPPEQKALFLDDFDFSQIRRGYVEGVQALMQHFGKIFLLVHSYPGSDLALTEFLDQKQLATSDLFEITASSYHHRLALIERWLQIGQDGELIDGAKTTAAKIAKMVDETIGRNFIPSVPIFVLIIVQQLEAGVDLDTVVKSGSHGFLYEAMITKALKHKVTVCDQTAAQTYLSALALLLSRRESEAMTQTEFEKFHVDHCERFALNISVRALQHQLENAEILGCKDDLVRFRYPFHLYYFLARSLSRQKDWPKLEASVEAHIATLHTERSANVLLFLAHLTGDSRIADRLLAYAKSLFASRKEFDFFQKLPLFDKYNLPEIRSILVEGDRAFQIENYLSDEQAADQGLQELETAHSLSSLEARVQESMSLNAAFKTMQVLGQVLRNHAGELEAPAKKEIAETCVALGRRALSFVVDAVGQHGALYIAVRGEKLRAEAYGSDAEIAEELAGYLPGLVVTTVVGTSIKIANAVGSEDLETTLREVLRGDETKELLGGITKLEHFSDFAADDLIRLKKERMSGQEFLPFAVLRRFIIRRFYLFPSREELRRSVCHAFGIEALPFSAMKQRKLGGRRK